MKGQAALAIHGGASAIRKLDYRRECSHLQALVERARDDLSRGATALDVATAVVSEMEASGLYVAGKGGSPNLAGDYELDAGLMDGKTRRGGAVAALQGFQSPIQVARLVMETTPHVLLVGEGAAAFARTCRAPEIDGDDWFTHAAGEEANYAPGAQLRGTVGCAVLDRHGNLAAATSSAGVFDKMPGRVGDSPLIGAGVWADDRVAISCTGQGELFILTASAAQIAFLVRSGRDLRTAAEAVLSEIRSRGGEGGLVAVDHEGNVEMPYNAEGMKRAALTRDGEIRIAVFDECVRS